MLASELATVLREAIDRDGDMEVLMDVTWPHEVYHVDGEGPLMRGGDEDWRVLLLQAGELAYG